MSQDEKALRKSIDKLEETESVIQQELSEIIGAPSRRQKELLGDLTRLQESLRGPEDLLDGRSYSRPFPPRHLRHGRNYPPQRGTDTPFGRGAQSGS